MVVVTGHGIGKGKRVYLLLQILALLDDLGVAADKLLKVLQLLGLLLSRLGNLNGPVNEMSDSPENPK